MDSTIPYCHIRNNKIVKDGKCLLDLPGIPLDDFLLETYSWLKVDYPKFYKMDTLSKLGFLASEILLSKKSYATDSIALVLSNSSSSLDTDKRYWETVKIHASPSLFVYTLPNIVMGEICIRHGIKGESIFFVTPKFDAEWITSYVDLLWNEENIKYCLAGWVEVMGDQADVFLYLADKSSVQSANKISELYHSWKS
jgi:hypothetical protein